jgi:hypothetical protein
MTNVSLSWSVGIYDIPTSGRRDWTQTLADHETLSTVYRVGLRMIELSFKMLLFGPLDLHLLAWKESGRLWPFGPMRDLTLDQ